MKRRLLITVLAVCLVGAGGFALKLWADGCCSGDPLCNGGAIGRIGCVYSFTVYHDVVDDEEHTVYVYIKEEGDSAYTAFLSSIHESPQPACLLYKAAIELEENKTYYYYFACADCEGRDPNEGTYTLVTGNCGG